MVTRMRNAGDSREEVKEDTRTKVNERVAIFNIIVEDADVSRNRVF